MAKLTQGWREVQIVRAVAQSALIEVYASRGGESWTILHTSPAGISCVIGSGTHWMSIPPEWAKKDPKA